VYNHLEIKSYKGTYLAVFEDNAFMRLNSNMPNNTHFIVDEKVADLYGKELGNVLESPSLLQIKATEANKTLGKFTGYIEHLVSHGVRRGHTLVAIGGGIIQDIVCFLSATFLRGLSWQFYPSTLLAQADSCIGSKSSINVGRTKNILGTYTPPEKIFIDPQLLKTLKDREIHSGIGEMLKVHAIDGPNSFDRIAFEYDQLTESPDVIQRFIRRSLEIKKRLIEIDEFDRGPRNVMNYGHSFGHAIESATRYGIPHGIAVSIGIDMANYAAWKLGSSTQDHFQRMHPVLRKNYRNYEKTSIPVTAFLAAIAKDKKNTDGQLRLILPDHEGRIGICKYEKNQKFSRICKDYLMGEIQK